MLRRFSLVECVSVLHRNQCLQSVTFFHFLMKLPDNFQMREHSWPCRFHITFNYHCGQTIFFVTIEYNNTLYNYPLWILLIDNVYRFVFFEYIRRNLKNKHDLKRAGVKKNVRPCICLYIDSIFTWIVTRHCE
jgi:hypothetical protein